MLPEIERLLVLQDRDRKIRALRQELKIAPSQRTQLEGKLTASIAQLDAAKLKAKEVEVERKKLENEAQAKRDQIAKYQVQKFQTRKNEEFQALTNEIKRFEGEVQTLEDRELEYMETIEKMKASVGEADKVTQTTKAQVERQLADIVTKTQMVEAQLKELEAERAKLATAVDEELLETYEHLFAGKSEAVVGLQHDVCTGCHMKVTAQTAVLVKGRRSICHCENCGRILYLDEQ
ncbi:MAG TPA: C4-type zinc ribbon domain-containing protein [Chthoniobacteraceae bacterium]|jgi:predicted  nucleic acid-binding Zn-ribbon protein|nr:putative zinc ribbon domain protein [Chthoniobacter sp.]HEV7866672.1 C4-type zinc ribbon domain-containing protein [Chthoniobacteraceae bacterium]